MSYNILNKGVKFQGDTQGTIEDIVDTHSTQTINGLKTVTHLTGTHVRVTNDAVVLGNVSASINISASAFYGDGANLTNTGVTVNSASENRIVTVAADTSQLDAELNLTFNASTKVLQLGNPLVTDTEFRIMGTITGSGNISGSAFYGDGSNLTGVQPTLKSGGGLNYDSNELEIKIDTLGLPIGGIDTTNDRFLIYDNSAGALKVVTPTSVGDLNEPAVSTFNGQTQHRVVTVAGSEQIEGASNLTFDGSILTITGNVSGSNIISGSIGHFVTRVEAGAISIGDATGLAGAGLANASGQLDIQVSGALKLSSDKIGITGSIAGYGLIYEGGVDSISSLKLDFGSLTETAISRTNDFIPFIDADDGEAKRESVVDFVGFIAGSGLDASSGQLSVDVSDFIGAIDANISGSGTLQVASHITSSGHIVIPNTPSGSIAGPGSYLGLGSDGKVVLTSSAGGGGGAVSAVASGADNRIATFSSSDALNGEANLQFDGTTLSINGAEGDAGAYSKIVVRKTGIADNSATAVVRVTIPNANHAACFKIFGFITTDSGSRVGTFEQSVAISRISGATAVGATATGIVSTEANSGGGGADYSIASTVTQSGGASASNTIDYNLVINTTDSSTTNAVFYVELLNFNSTGVTMAAV